MARYVCFLFVPSLYIERDFQAGGKEDSAQGSGVNVDRLPEALKIAQDYVTQM